ncbi:MAG: acylphosphatase [Eubacteriales bacterium]|nr:acylphosphatase [Eubacteriales bacterium]
MIRKHIIFYGRVQGVGFRFYAVNKARQLGLTGWVENLYDGSVEMEVQGTEEKIDELVYYLDQQRFIRIEGMDVKRQEVISEGSFRERGY